MNGSNCHPGLRIIAEMEGGKRIRQQPKPLGAAGTEADLRQMKVKRCLPQDDGDNLIKRGRLTLERDLWG